MPWELPGQPNAPKPVRSAESLWGLEGLNQYEQGLVEGDNQLILRMVWLWLVADVGRQTDWHRDLRLPSVAFGMEHPGDPRDYLGEDSALWSACPSVWRTELIEMLAEIMELRKYDFDQGAYGHEQRKPTGFLANMELGLYQRDPRLHHPRPVSSGSMAVWAVGFRREIARGLDAWAKQQAALLPVAVNKVMSEKELAEWKAHVEAGHWPYRRDCAVCLAASGTGRPARKVLRRDAYVMSLDVAGLFRDVGEDEKKGGKYRFALAATYVFPKTTGVPEDAPTPDLEEDMDYLEQGEDEEESGQGDLAEDLGADAQEEEWLRIAGDLQKPMEFQTLRFVVPLENHKGKDILEAVQDLYISLRASGYPLARIHSDRAKEFRTKQLRKWCRDRDIYQTYTEGLAPSQNAGAENHVKWLKCRARALLQDAQLGKSYWPCAMKHACLLHNKRVMGQKAPGIRFGSKVWVRSKEEHLGPFDKRWVEGVFLGPAEDVREGFVIKLEDGAWFRTLHMREAVNVLDENEGVDTGDFEAVDPPPTRRVTGKTRVTNQEEEVIEEPPQPTTRITSKRSLEGPTLRRAAGQPSGERRKLVEEILTSGIWDAKEARAKRPQLQGNLDAEQRYVTFGAFQHGGVVNVTNATIEFTEVAEKVAKLIQMDFPGEIFTSVTLTKNALMPLHRDIFNLKGSFSLVSPLKVGKGGAIWQEMKFGVEFYGNFEFREVDGKEVPGQKMSVEKPVKVIPQRWHQPIPGEGPDRVLAVGHTIGSWVKLSSEVREQLEMIGVVVPREDVKVAAMVVECEDGEVFSVDVTSGSSGEAAPNSNTAAPNPDTADPNPNTAGPNPDTAGPNPDTAGPNPDTADPNPDTADPNPDTAGPNPDTAVSGFSVVTPQETGAHQNESTLANPGVSEDRTEWIQQMAYLTQQGFTSSSSGPASSMRTISTFESHPRPRVPLPDPDLNAYFLDPGQQQGQQQHPSSSSAVGGQAGPVTGGQREDCMVVPGGRVNMKLAWEMQYVPDHQSVPVRVVEEPVFPLEADERAGTRRRLEWLTELMTEELDIETKREPAWSSIIDMLRC